MFGKRPSRDCSRSDQKLHEEFLRGDLADLLEMIRKRPPRGEITLLIGAGEAESQPADQTVSLKERVEQLETNGEWTAKRAQTGRARAGLAKREAYKQLLLER